MGLGTTRKVLAVILSVILAFGTAGLLASLVINATLSNRSFVEKHLITDELVAECTAQLDAKYEVLEAETGIPFRVFEAVKTDNPVDRSIASALQNAFGAEDTGLYSNNMVNYFENLCTEYLTESEIPYQEEDVARTADRAAVIFGETVGLHEIDSLSVKMQTLKRAASGVSAVAIFVVVLCAILLMTLYTDRRKAAIYAFSGAAAGSLGTALGAAGCVLFRVASGFNVSPAIYQAAVESIERLYFLMLGAAALVACAAFYSLLILYYRRVHKKSQRHLIL